MRPKTLLPVLLGLAACATAPTPTCWPPAPAQSDKLVEATRLTLQGEELLAQGDRQQADTCFASARAACDEVLRDAPDSALAHRIRGRTMLRQWPQFGFDDARNAFALAKQHAGTDLDRQRADDYLELVAGLEAFTAGKPAEAWQAWARVQDQEIKDSLTARVRDLHGDATFGGVVIE